MARTYSRDVVLEALAARLGGAWLAQTQFAELDSGEIPKTRAEAYLVADRMAEHIRDHLSGWKVGATSAVMRELDGHSDVIPGRIFRSVTWEGESFALPTKMFPNARAEAEFAFRLNEDVTDAAINDPEQMAEIAVLHPAIELIGNRFSATGLTAEQNSLMTVADNGGGIGFVLEHRSRTGGPLNFSTIRCASRWMAARRPTISWATSAARRCRRYAIWGGIWLGAVIA